MDTNARPIERLAFIGTGLMGFPMARNLTRAGFALTVWNRTRARAEPLVADGASVADSAGEAVADADAVLVMLENRQAVEAVLLSEAVLDGLARHAVIVDFSSIPPSAARALAERMASRGCAYLDAPVSGGTAGAEAASLAIMAGGDARAFARCGPVFAALGHASHIGASGTGQLAKLANQVIVALSIGAVGEALVLAAAGGADPERVRTALRSGFADSRVLELHGKRMTDRDFAPGGPMRIFDKDLATIAAEASALGIDLPLFERARALFAELGEDHAEHDHSALLLALEARNPSVHVRAGGHSEDAGDDDSANPSGITRR
ncbi:MULTISPECIES: NAD(P)-dependent oxidoreductase [unclassified Roseitalea]|uniref:NAD(P)-dependent oxidoreductase n=1 Tax=unclassified Roseitalea TaxID=2639107 RepID=UPI00273D4286|nr:MULTISPECIES: NAD(P)-dependent oxidoreductase [unclassified Roseitalea]